MPPVPLEFAEVARTLLASELGPEAVTPGALAAATTRVWEKLAKHFAMLVGEMGVRTLFDRTMFLTAASYPWLAGVTGIITIAPAAQSAWTPLAAILEQHHEPRAATEAVEALIATFVGLVSRFIGPGLVIRLLNEMWPELFASDVQETP